MMLRYTTLWLLAILAAPASAADWYIAPDGKDAAAGTQDAPFATLNKARDAIRTHKKDEAHTVWVADGNYTLSSPFVLTAEDSGTPEHPIVYRAMKGADPTFSGGSVITDWKQEGNLWQATLPTELRKPLPEQLIAGQQSTTLAREPDQGLFTLVSVSEDAPEKGPAKQTLRLTSEDYAATLAKVTPEELSQVQFLAYHKWDNTRRHLDQLLPEEHALVTSGRKMKGHNPLNEKTQVRIENYAAALDTPGEWHASADGQIRYYPREGENPSQMQMIVPRLEQLLIVRGKPEAGELVQHVELRGLRFLHARWTTPKGGFEPSQAASPIEAAIQIDGARHLTIADCEFGHIGIYGVWFRRGCQHCTLERSWIHDTGAGGVRIGETSMRRDPKEQTSHITADNNILNHGGRIFPCAVGLWIGHSPDNQVTHNEIADYFYSGISVGWRWGYRESFAKRNTIAKNHVHHLGYGVLSDMGGIYTLGPSEGTVVRGNIFHDIHAYSYGGWGLYTDEGSSDIVFENNVVYRTKTGGFHQHYGKDNIVQNNILAFAQLYQLKASRVEPHRSFVLQRNIVFYDQGELLHGQWSKVKHDSSNNCFFDASGRDVTFEGNSLEQWQAQGHEQGSIVADPKFTDPENFDFTLAEDSPALKLGFRPFKTDDVGVYGDQQWIDKAKSFQYAPVRPE
ncbi:right-handed parallel beta-helix repeat-containing protein [Bremerella alba]|uniref:Right handed beta helix domain-containing protein n=1 Tax=Bremerella alba TaxID=980252 RepID=A0A7V8V920_9BACT|nr:right-handed parallel beta-helix repeat-containing protein [Bremerella alba]MBA2117168.1 hypothetical protein [Bremerella alba]